MGDVAMALERMRKEHYIVREKGESLKRGAQDGAPVAEFWCKLGPRAYVECVILWLIVLVMATLGVPVCGRRSLGAFGDDAAGSSDTYVL